MYVCVYVCLSVEFKRSSLHPLTAFTLLVSRHLEKWEEVPGTYCLCMCKIPLVICILLHGADPEIEEVAWGGGKEW